MCEGEMKKKVKLKSVQGENLHAFLMDLINVWQDIEVVKCFWLKWCKNCKKTLFKRGPGIKYILRFALLILRTFLRLI